MSKTVWMLYVRTTTKQGKEILHRRILEVIVNIIEFFFSAEV